jgi:hypothetical protein
MAAHVRQPVGKKKGTAIGKRTLIKCQFKFSIISLVTVACVRCCFSKTVRELRRNVMLWVSQHNRARNDQQSPDPVMPGQMFMEKKCGRIAAKCSSTISRKLTPETPNKQ